jgi:hypothetical protein
MSRTIRIGGPLTDPQIARVVALIREFDNEDPQGEFTVLIEDTRSNSRGEGRALMAAILPPREGRRTTPTIGFCRHCGGWI